MVDLTTTYLGLTLTSPIVASASPLWEHVENIEKAAEAGAGAVVLFSLFEEQITRERDALLHHLTHGTETFAEALSYFPEPTSYHAAPDAYLKLIQTAKQRVNIPIIASLNGTTNGGWVSFAKFMQEAGADALELNLYNIPTDPMQSPAEIEANYAAVVREVCANVSIPVAVKISPFFTNVAYTAREFVEAGARGLVLFNRFYQPDLDIENLEVTPNLVLSKPVEQRLPLTWIGLLYGRINADLAATSGIHDGYDVIKAMMAGANVAMMTSALLKYGIGVMRQALTEMHEWLTERDYHSVTQMRGALSQLHTPDKSAFERVQYMRMLNTYEVGQG